MMEGSCSLACLPTSAYSVTHPIQLKPICQRTEPPKVGWTLLHPLAIKNMQMCSLANLIKTNLQGSFPLSRQVSLDCIKLTINLFSISFMSSTPVPMKMGMLVSGCHLVVESPSVVPLFMVMSLYLLSPLGWLLSLHFSEPSWGRGRERREAGV